MQGDMRIKAPFFQNDFYVKSDLVLNNFNMGICFFNYLSQIFNIP